MKCGEIYMCKIKYFDTYIFSANLYTGPIDFDNSSHFAIN